MVFLDYRYKEEPFLKRILLRMDWFLFWLVVSLCVIGILIIFSATYRFGSSEVYISKQVIAFIIGMLLCFLFTFFNYQILREYYFVFYIFSIVSLILVLLFGQTYRGTKAWLDLGIFTFQPSEISKVFFIITLAGFLDRRLGNTLSVKEILIAAGLYLLLVFLILLEPDFSGTVIYFPILIAMLFMRGLKFINIFSIFLYLFVTISFTILFTYLSAESPTSKSGLFIVDVLKGSYETLFILLVILIFFITAWWILKKLMFNIRFSRFLFIYLVIVCGVITSIGANRFLKEYQRKRLLAFVNPNIEPVGAGYNIIQSRIAIGSGKILGKGYLSGTQGQLGFIPARHTDFIFSLLSEEFGLVGSSLLIFLYILLFLRMTNIAINSRDSFGSLLAVGISVMFGSYLIINIGINLGIIPVIGLPLPFISYGGSNLVSSLLSIGLLESIWVRRYFIR